MRQREMHRFLYDQQVACTVLQIEYSGTALLLLALPDPGKMRQAEAALRPETLRRWGQRVQPRWVPSSPALGLAHCRPPGPRSRATLSQFLASTTRAALRLALGSYVLTGRDLDRFPGVLLAPVSLLLLPFSSPNNLIPEGSLV